MRGYIKGFMLLCLTGAIVMTVANRSILDAVANHFRIEIPVDRIVEVPIDPNERDLQTIITDESSRAGVPGLITLAMAHVESSTSLNQFATRFEPSTYTRIKADNDTTRRALASSHGLLQVMGWHASTTCKGIVRHWSELYQPVKNLRCGLKILNDCLGKFAKITDPSERVTKALGCYNGDGDTYPQLVKRALADLVIDRLASEK